MPDHPAEGPVLVLVDGSEVGWLALETAAGLAGDAACGVVCLAVAPPRLTPGSAAPVVSEDEALDVGFADGILAEAQRRLLASDVESVRRTGRPVRTVAEEARRTGARSIVVGRRPPLTGLALPDFADQLARATDVPVVVVELPDRPLPAPRRPTSR